jgi:glucose/arabinose dehydrogenase
MLVEHARGLPRLSLRGLAGLLSLLALLASLTGCSGGGGSPGTADTPLPAPPSPASPLLLAVRQVASGLDSPVFLTAPAGDRRQFIVERPGRVRIVQNGALLALPFLDISARVFATGEGGLLSIAFHPQYAANGLFFIYYTDHAGDIVVERLRVSSNPNVADPTAVLEIIRIPHPGFTNHYGGLVAFGPDGFLYLGTGDGGGVGDPAGNAQNLAGLLGKLLRLDVSGAIAGAPYTIPPGNPFAGQAGRRAEIWAFGLRNPWRFAFDGGNLTIADVGQDKREEIDLSPMSQGGLNYGWNIREGSLCYNAASCAGTLLTAPAFEYDHAAGCSITGGYVYRGVAIPELAGRYFYSDYCGGFLKSFVAAGTGGGGARAGELADWDIGKLGGIVSFGRDADGELYLISAGGAVYKLVRAGTG